MGTSAVGHSVCAKNICATANDQCLQNFPGLCRPIDRLSHPSGNPLFSPLLIPLSQHYCFVKTENNLCRAERDCSPQSAKDQKISTRGGNMEIHKMTCITALILALAAPAGGDAVTVWNANAGVAATTSCISPGGD